MIEEIELIREVKTGNRQVFGELVSRHQQRVYNLAWRMLGENRDAEDATQETFLRAFRAFRAFDDERPLTPWLMKIAVNVCLNMLQVQKEGEPYDEERTSSRGHGVRVVEGAVQADERRERIEREILRLAPRYRAVIELRHFQEMSYQEMASALQRPLSDIKSDLFRARRLLADRLKGLEG